MALDDLRKNIEHEARKEVSRLEKESDSQVEKVLHEAREKASQMKKHAKESAVAEAEQRKKDSATSLELETATMLSAAREEAIDGEMAGFVAMTKKSMKSKEKELISSALKRFSAVMPLDNAVVKLDKRNAELVKTTVAKVEQASIDGVKITSVDGKVSADATIDGMVESNMDIVRRILSKGMF